MKVVLLLPPFHPDAYQACKDNPNYRMTLEVEAYLRALARAEGFAVIGSFDPEKYGFRGDEFFDGIHGHDMVMQKLFQGYR